MKLILFIIVFTCIILIKFFAFIIKSAFDAAQIINERPRKLISKVHNENEKKIFETIFIPLVRKYELCATAENSIEELIIAVEIYLLFINLFYCYSGLSDTRIIKETIYTFLAEVIEYVNKNAQYLNFDNLNPGLTNINSYNIETLKDLYIKERHFLYFSIHKALSFAEINRSQYHSKLVQSLDFCIYQDLKYKYSDKFQEVFLLSSKKKEIIESIINEIIQVSILFSQEIIQKQKYNY